MPYKPLRATLTLSIETTVKLIALEAKIPTLLLRLATLLDMAIAVVPPIGLVVIPIPYSTLPVATTWSMTPCTLGNPLGKFKKMPVKPLFEAIVFVMTKSMSPDVGWMRMPLPVFAWLPSKTKFCTNN